MDQVHEIEFSGTWNAWKMVFLKDKIDKSFLIFSHFFAIFDDFSKFCMLPVVLYFEKHLIWSHKFGKNCSTYSKIIIPNPSLKKVLICIYRSTRGVFSKKSRLRRSWRPGRSNLYCQSWATCQCKFIWLQVSHKWHLPSKDFLFGKSNHFS